MPRRLQPVTFREPLRLLEISRPAVPKLSGTRLFAHTKWLVRWYLVPGTKEACTRRFTPNVHWQNAQTGQPSSVPTVPAAARSVRLQQWTVKLIAHPLTPSNFCDNRHHNAHLLRNELSSREQPRTAFLAIQQVMTSRDNSSWFYFVLNVTASLAIVLVNKLVFLAGFQYVCTLTVFHQVCTALIGRLLHASRPQQTTLTRQTTSVADCLLYAVLFNTSVVSMNFSLKLNTMGSYQIMKLAVLPTVALLEAQFLQVQISSPVSSALHGVLQGSYLALLDDLHSLNVNVIGISVGLVAIFSTASQTVHMKILQSKCDQSQQHVLLSRMSTYSSGVLMLFAPILDASFTGKTLSQYCADNLYILSRHSQRNVLLALLCSCVIASVLNASQFMIIGKFSPLTFQVLGQVKMVGVITLGMIQLGEALYVRKLLGAIVVMCASWMYATLKTAPTSRTSSKAYQQQFFVMLGWFLALCTSFLRPVKIL